MLLFFWPLPRASRLWFICKGGKLNKQQLLQARESFSFHVVQREKERGGGDVSPTSSVQHQSKGPNIVGVAPYASRARVGARPLREHFRPLS